jgi:hypothetical protein
VTILKRRAARLRRKTGNNSLKTVYDDDEGVQGLRKLWDAVLRPLVVFLDSSVLQALSLFESVAFSYFYVMSTTMPDIVEDIYHLPPALTGVYFMSFSNSSKTI